MAMSDPLLLEIINGPKRLRAVCRTAERAEIAKALIENRHNRTHTAAALGISRRTLLNKIKEYGLTRRDCTEHVRQPILIFPAVAQIA